MLPTIIWLIICCRGLWVWGGNSIQARKNRLAVEAHDGEDDIAILVVRSDRIQDNLRASAFFLYIVLGVGALLLQDKAFAFHHLEFVRYFGDFLQAVLVFGTFVFALNGEITKWVQGKVLRSIK